MDKRRKKKTAAYSSKVFNETPLAVLAENILKFSNPNPKHLNSAANV
jgi:hypothetical protein